MKKAIVVLFIVFCSVMASSQNIDIRILRSLNSPQSLPADKFFQFVSNSDAYFAIGIPAVTGTIGLLRKDNELFRNSCVTLAATVVNSGITMAMKYSFNRTRPFITYPDITKKSGAGSPSFPSGHTSMAFATATSFSLAYPKWYVVVPSYTWAGSVGYSRMRLGVHYPSDVLAGALIGSGCAWITYSVNKRLNIKSAHVSQRPASGS